MAEADAAVATAREYATSGHASAFPLTDWTLRPFARPGRSPWVVAAWAAAAFTLLSQAARAGIALAGSPQALGFEYGWVDALNGVLFAYILAALWLLRGARQRDLREIERSLRPDAELEPLARAMLCPSPRRLAAAGLAGACLIGALPFLDPEFFEGERPPVASAAMLFFVVRMAVTGWVAGRAVATEATAVTALARIGERCMRVDLSDLRPFEVFARAGQRSAFTWVAGSSLISLFWLGPGSGVVNAFLMAAVFVAVGLAFFAGILGAHRSIAAARREALRAVEARIAHAAETLMAGGAEAASPRMADLVAWHAFLDRVREWPIGGPTLVRTALLALLAVGGWLGGALVERILDRAFG